MKAEILRSLSILTISFLMMFSNTVQSGAVYTGKLKVISVEPVYAGQNSFVITVESLDGSAVHTHNCNPNEFGFKASGQGTTDDFQWFNKIYSLALTALTTGNPIKIHTSDGTDCPVHGAHLGQTIMLLTN